jgi:hypothetical protein
MPALVINEASSCATPVLDIFTKQGGSPVNVSELSFQIFEKVTSPGTPVQVFPPSGKEAVDVSTDCPTGDRIETGHYVARYTVPPLSLIGTHEIRWFFKLSPTVAEQQFFEEFEVLPSVFGSSGAYVSVSEVRAKGLSDPPTDSDIQASITLWQSFLERACRQWFRPISLTLEVDGTDSDALHFGVPIISIDEIRINNEETALGTDRFKVYSERQMYTDRQNPRIKLVDTFSDRRDIFTAPIRGGRTLFMKGRKNQFIKGTFGYTEVDGSTPELIKHALCKLVIEKLTTPILPIAGITPPPIISGLKLEEKTDGHQIKFQAPGGGVNPRAPGLVGITQDQEILTIIKLFKAPIGVATPAHPSWRG